MKKTLFVLFVIIAPIHMVISQQFLGRENIVYLSDIVAPAAVSATDLDADQDIDVVVALENKIFWYANTGTKQVYGSDQTIRTFSGTLKSIDTKDLNGDGHTDILVARDNMLLWLENSGDQGIFDSLRVVDTLDNGILFTLAADLDGDADMDVLVSSRNKARVSWYENTDGNGTYELKQAVDTSGDWIQSMYAADIDGDNDLDLLSASAFNDKIAWYENTDGNGTFSVADTITTSADYARSVSASDLDGDGDLDVLSASAYDDKIAWYENTDGAGSFSGQKIIALTADNPQYVYASDLDGDGDQDVFSASFFDDKVAWYENTDGNGTFSGENVISTVADQAGYVFAGDLDGDGDQDVISASCDFKIAWHKNTLPFRITGSPQNRMVRPDSSVQLRVTANEYATAFQWQLDTGNGFTNIPPAEQYSGVTTNTLTINDFHKSMSDQPFRCLVSSNTDTLYSGMAVLMAAPVDDTVKADANCQGIVPDYVGNLMYTQTPSPYSKFSGSTTVRLRNSDSAENDQEILFTIFTEDKTPPNLSGLPGSFQLQKNDAGEIILPDFTGLNMVISDNCSDRQDITVSQSPEANTLVEEMLEEVTLSATDSAGNTVKASIQLQMPDLAPPSITAAPSNEVLAADADCQAILPDYTQHINATDNNDWLSTMEITQSPVPYTTVSGADNQVTITVTDTEGNSTDTTFHVHVTDQAEPTIQCADNQVLEVASGTAAYKISGTSLDPVSAEDNCSIASIRNNLNNAASLDGAEITQDTTDVIWTVTDEAGNQAQCSLKVIVNGLTGIEALKNKGILIYPNPSGGIFLYETENRIIEHLKVTDMSGRMVFEETRAGKRGRINLSAFPDGIYHLSIKTRGDSYVVKILKE